MKSFNLATRTTVAGALVALAPLAFGVSAFAATTQQDRTFAMMAAQGGMAEVADAKVAEAQGSDQKVKSFAAKMIADHTKANMKLMSIAKSNDVMLPASLAPSDAAMKSKLSTMSGASFDSAYLTGQIAGHEKMETLMKTEIASGTNPELVAFAKATLPTVEEHLSLAKADK